MDAALDKRWQRCNEAVSGDEEAIAEIVPERDAALAVGLAETEESIAAIAASVTAGAGADLATRGMTADVILRTIDVQGCLWPVEHHQQRVFVGMKAGEQAIQFDEAGSAAEDAIEPGPQGLTAACTEAQLTGG